MVLLKAWNWNVKKKWEKSNFGGKTYHLILWKTDWGYVGLIKENW